MWNPAQYELFQSERAQPFYDLLALVKRQPEMRVIDLGCGTGELTAVLHRHLAARATLGVDNSANMLARSATHATSGLEFRLADIAELASDQQYDLIFSNAALQWIPDHWQLISRLSALLAPGGQLAVQVPANHDHPAHQIAAAVAQEPPFHEALSGYVRQKPILEPEEYATLLDRLGFTQQHVRLQVYSHHLPNREAVVEWVKGTLLTDYQRRMSAEHFEAFLVRYRARLLNELDATEPYFYPFKRLLFWAQR